MTRTGLGEGSAPRAHPSPSTHLSAFFCPGQRRRRSSEVSAGPPSCAPTPGQRGALGSRAYGATPFPPHQLLCLDLPVPHPRRGAPEHPRLPPPLPLSLNRGTGAASPLSLTRRPQPAPLRPPSYPGGERGARRRGRDNLGTSAAAARTRGSAPRPVSAHLSRRVRGGGGSSGTRDRSPGIGRSGSVTCCGSVTQGQPLKVSHLPRIGHLDSVTPGGSVIRSSSPSQGASPRGESLIRTSHPGSVTYRASVTLERSITRAEPVSDPGPVT